MYGRPRIERDFDIDINEYFCLRIARYFRDHRDISFLEEMYDAYLKSVDFILSFDRDREARITVNFKNRDFDTVLLLPRNYGRIRVPRQNGVLTCSEAVRKGYKVTAVEA